VTAPNEHTSESHATTDAVQETEARPQIRRRRLPRAPHLPPQYNDGGYPRPSTQPCFNVARVRQSGSSDTDAPPQPATMGCLTGVLQRDHPDVFFGWPGTVMYHCELHPTCRDFRKGEPWGEERLVWEVLPAASPEQTGPPLGIPRQPLPTKQLGYPTTISWSPMGPVSLYAHTPVLQDEAVARFPGRSLLGSSSSCALWLLGKWGP